MQKHSFILIYFKWMKFFLRAFMTFVIITLITGILESRNWIIDVVKGSCHLATEIKDKLNSSFSLTLLTKGRYPFNSIKLYNWSSHYTSSLFCLKLVIKYQLRKTQHCPIASVMSLSTTRSRNWKIRMHFQSFFLKFK